MQCSLLYDIKERIFLASLYHGRGFHCLSSTIGKNSDLLNKRAQIWRKVFQPTDKDFKHYHLHVEVRQNRNVHDYLADLDSEVPLYMKVERLNHPSSFSLEKSFSHHRQASLSSFCPVGLLLLPQSLCRLNRRFVGIKSFCKSSHFILARLCKSKSYYLNLARLCKLNPFIWFQVLSLAVDLYQHCYWEVTIGRDM